MIPDTHQCVQLMLSTGMLDNIKRHSFVVAKVATFLGKLLSFYGCPLDISLIEAGSLLHDIGKTESLLTGENHAKMGAQIVREAGYEELAPVVENHIRLLDEELKEPIDEVKLVNYADKRVLHDRIVTLEHRFEDLRERYGNTAKKKRWLSEMERKMKMLERKIFSKIPISPEYVLYLDNNLGNLRFRKLR